MTEHLVLGRRSTARRSRVALARCLLAAACGLPLCGCARLHAKNTPETPPLEVPAPPPRVVDTPDIDAPAPVPLPEEPARHPTTGQRRTAPAPTRPEPVRTEPPKPDQNAAPPAQTEPPKAPEEAPKPPTTTLQTIPPEAEADFERTVRSQLQHASSDLGRVDYRALKQDARTQYDSAKGLVRQAEDALRAKNLVFAKSLADKAAALAAQLAGK